MNTPKNVRFFYFQYIATRREWNTYRKQLPFPDSFEFVGTKDSQFQQVGNAVPPLLAKGIAEKVLEYIE